MKLLKAEDAVNWKHKKATHFKNKTASETRDVPLFALKAQLPIIVMWSKSGVNHDMTDSDTVFQISDG
jgi:hypothetical protein